MSFLVNFQKTKLDSADLVSQYSNNDKAIDFINNGLMYLEAKIYTEAIKNFNQGLKVEADIIDKNASGKDVAAANIVTPVIVLEKPKLSNKCKLASTRK